MTPEKATVYLGHFERWNADEQWLSNDTMKEFVECCTEALLEIQQYRQIGTVENLKSWCSLFGLNGFKELEEYKKIGSEEECREAMEKQKAKSPILINYKEYADKIANADFLQDSYLCPNCKTVLRSGSYCNRCGQKLDWNENLEGAEDDSACMSQ